MEDPDLHLRALRRNISGLEICYDKPADCYYRNQSDAKTKSIFYFNSIKYRILFYKKIVESSSDMQFVKENRGHIRTGIINLLRNFVFSRRNEFPALYIDLLDLMKGSKLFSFVEIQRTKLLTDWGNQDSVILKNLRIKGLCYRLLPKA
jgi:hypothetical protein